MALHQAGIPDGTVFDEVVYEGWPRILGRSWQLDPSVPMDASANDAEASWCPGTTLIPNAIRDLGTPGVPNDCVDPDDPDVEDTAGDSQETDSGSSPGPDSDTEVAGTDTQVDTDVVDDGILRSDEWVEGDLVITETAATNASTARTSTLSTSRSATPPTRSTSRVRCYAAVRAVTRFEVLDHVLVEPGEVIVGARFGNPRCHDFADFFYTNFVIDNGGDRIRSVVTPD